MSNPITISLTRHREPDWLVRDALVSLASQYDVAGRVLFVDQAPNANMQTLCRDLSEPHLAIEHIETDKQSLSKARNLAIAKCDTEVLLYLDIDAVASPQWAACLTSSLTDGGAAIAGGRIVPRWHGRPLLAIRSGWVCEQYSLLDLGSSEFEARKVIGANFGMNLKRCGAEATFDEGLGRRNGQLLGGEETDLCRRVAAHGLKILYNGAAVVEHQILPERITYRWLARRFYFAGIDRAITGGIPQPSHGMALWDLLLAPFYLVPYTTGYVRGCVK